MKLQNTLLVALVRAGSALATGQETLPPTIQSVTENNLGTQITINGTGLP
jgi:hypothetical protein